MEITPRGAAHKDVPADRFFARISRPRLKYQEDKWAPQLYGRHQGGG